MIKNILLVGLGGGPGSIARYLSQKWFAAKTDSSPKESFGQAYKILSY